MPFSCFIYHNLVIYDPPPYVGLTSLDQLTGHEESGGAGGAVVVHVNDGDASQTQAVVNGPLSTCGVP